MALIRFKRGSRAQVEAAAAAGGLREGEPYYVTDEERLAIGTGASEFVEPVMPGDLPPVLSESDVNGLIDARIGPIDDVLDAILGGTS